MDDTIRKSSDRRQESPKKAKQSKRMRPVLLAVGEIRLWKQAGHLLRNSSDLAYADFQDLTPELLELIGPDVVLSPMVARSFDCLDLSHFLYDAGFGGRYRIVSVAVAKPNIILAEILASCPGLDVSILEMTDGQSPKLH